MQLQACSKNGTNYLMKSFLRKWLGISAILSAFTIGFVFWDALVGEFVPRDGLRAFRYESHKAPDVKTCLSRFGKLYVLTGRPLMIVGECWEHATTEKVSDLKIGRWLSVGVLVVVVAMLSLLFNLYGAPPPLALGTAVGIGVLPGMSFMVLQGGTAIFSIVGILLALWGIHGLLTAVREKQKLRRLALAALPLYFSLYCYPQFSFIALILAGAYYLWAKESFKAKTLNVAILVLTCVVTVAIYYGTVKIWTLVQYGSFNGEVDLRERNFKLSSESVFRWAPFLRDVLWTRFGLWSAASPELGLRWGVVAVLVTNVLFSWRSWREQLGVGFVYLALMLAASAPFVVSAMPLGNDAFRYCFPARAFLSLGLGAACYRLFKFAFPQREKLCAVLSVGLLLFLAIPAASLRVSSTVKNGVTEWWAAKEFGKELVTKLELSHLHHVHVVRPTRPFFGEDYRGEENTIALTSDPEHVSQIVNAVLREAGGPAVFGEITVLTTYSDRGEPLPRVIHRESFTNHLWDFSRVTIQP